MRRQHLLLLTAWLLVLPAVALDEIRLAGGQVIKGELQVQKAGVFHALANGGRLYRWEDLDPASLPEAVRDQRRQEVLGWLLKAHAFYLREDLNAAVPLYRSVFENRDYLSDEDRGRAEYADISLKAKGLVEYEGEYLSFAERQQRRGLVRYEGKWRKQEEVAAENAVKAAVWKARAERDPVKAIADLQAVLKAYPETPRRPEVLELIEKLRHAAEPALAKAPKEVAEAPPAPNLDDYYVSLPGKLEEALAATKPDLPDPVYPDSSKTSDYPYFKDDDPRPYYIPKYTRDQEGNYHYTIDGISYKSRQPPPRVYLKR